MWGLDLAEQHVAASLHATPDKPAPALDVRAPFRAVVPIVAKAARTGKPCARFVFSGTPWCDDCGHSH